MKKDDYKRVFDQVQPDAGLKKRIAANLHGNRKTIYRNPVAIILAGFVLLISTSLLITQFKDETQSKLEPPKQVSAGQALFIPKLQLPNKTNGEADMIGLIVYKGKVYTQTSTSITVEAAELLLGEKIGKTKGNIDEWSSQDDYATELASTIGEADVYKVKGYSDDFRIMVFSKRDGVAWAEFYECLNGLEVKNGADVFGKMNILGHIESAAWERHSSWDENKQIYQPVEVDETIKTFVQNLHEALPILQEDSQVEGIFDDGSKQKFLMLTLEDGSIVQLRLFDQNLVYYEHLFFKMDEGIFTKVWDRLQ